MAIHCPACGASNPDHSWQCSCGHYFVTTMPEVPIAAPESATISATGAVAPSEPQTRRLWFHGQGGALLEIYILNLLLTF